MIDWSRNQADEIIACARRWVKRLDERGVYRGGWVVGGAIAATAVVEARAASQG